MCKIDVTIVMLIMQTYSHAHSHHLFHHCYECVLFSVNLNFKISLILFVIQSRQYSQLWLQDSWKTLYLNCNIHTRVCNHFKLTKEFKCLTFDKLDILVSECCANRTIQFLPPHFGMWQKDCIEVINSKHLKLKISKLKGLHYSRLFTY